MKFRDLPNTYWINKMDAVALVAENLDDPDGRALSERKDMVRKAATRAAKNGEFQMRIVRTIGRGRNQKCLDEVEKDKFFAWAAARYPEILGADRLGPKWTTETINLDVGLSAIIDKEPPIFDDVASTVAAWRAERNRLLDELDQAKDDIARLELERDTWKAIAQMRVAVRANISQGLRGKKRCRE